MTRGPYPGRRDRVEPLADPARRIEGEVMPHMHVETRVEAPVEHVWAFYRDTSRWQDWMPRDRNSGFSGPVDEVGTTYVSTMWFMGREFTTTQRVVEVEPLRLIHEHNDEGPMESYLRFEPDGAATRLVYDADWERPGKVPGFIKELVNKGWAERHMRQVLADFKALAEVKGPAPT